MTMGIHWRPACHRLSLGVGMIVGLNLGLSLVATGCGDGESGTNTASRPDPALALLTGETIERKAELGPVTAVVKVAPPAPTLGDPIVLVLEVTAEPGVTVEMPDFGEALGRFGIARFVPRENVVDGKRVATQVYTLQAPMSGKQRIPPLRIEFIDNRTDAQKSDPSADPSGNPPDPGANKTDPAGSPADPGAQATGASRSPDGDDDGDGPGEIRELLTEEIAIQVASLLPEDLEKTELAGVRGRLRVPSPADSIFASPWFWIPVGLILALLMYFTIGKFLAQARKQRRISAYAAAIERLGKLESRGLPEPDEADDWYVELSGIIRRYLEDRYNLRAPELTTEEFLKIARSSGVLSTDHRKLLETFLIRCDKVKFARYAPEDEESKDALASARTFLEDTRPQAQADRQKQEMEAAA